VVGQPREVCAVTALVIDERSKIALIIRPKQESPIIDQAFQQRFIRRGIILAVGRVVIAQGNKHVRQLVVPKSLRYIFVCGFKIRIADTPDVMRKNIALNEDKQRIRTVRMDALQHRRYKRPIRIVPESLPGLDTFRKRSIFVGIARKVKV